MNYEEKYNEALEVMRQWIAPCHTKEQLDTLKKSVFPELAESEDERIREWLVNYFETISKNWLHGHVMPLNSILTWLEKQKEQIPLMDGDADLYFDNWIQHNSASTKRQCFEAGITYYERLLQEQKEQKPWKVGANAYFIPEQKPTDLSEMMVHKEPYIAPVPTPMVADEQKQEWSEEEKEILDSILSHYVLIDKPIDANGISKEKYISLIKSIRFDTYKNCNSHWKPSEEQMKALKVTLEYMPDTFKPRCTLMTLQNDLEKLM